MSDGKAEAEKAIADLKAQGAEIVDPFVIREYERLTDKCGDFQKDLNTYLTLHAPNAYYKSLSEIVDSGLYLPYIEARLKTNVAPKTEAQLARGPCVDTYHDPKKIAFRDAVLGEMDKQHVDALVYPTWSNAPRKVGDIKSPAGDNSQMLSPQTGFPAITVPMGFTYDSLPAGMTILGRSFSEGLLTKYAYAMSRLRSIGGLRRGLDRWSERKRIAVRIAIHGKSGRIPVVLRERALRCSMEHCDFIRDSASNGIAGWSFFSYGCPDFRQELEQR